jgi:hypothetical protein
VGPSLGEATMSPAERATGSADQRQESEIAEEMKIRLRMVR